MNQDIEELIHEIDHAFCVCEQLIACIARGMSGREISRVRTKIQEARFWAIEAQRLINQHTQHTITPDDSIVVEGTIGEIQS